MSNEQAIWDPRDVAFSATIDENGNLGTVKELFAPDADDNEDPDNASGKVVAGPKLELLVRGARPAARVLVLADTPAIRRRVDALENCRADGSEFVFAWEYDTGYEPIAIVLAKTLEDVDVQLGRLATSTNSKLNWEPLPALPRYEGTYYREPRKYLFDAVNDWIAQSAKRSTGSYCVIVGGTGRGKSRWLNQFIRDTEAKGLNEDAHWNTPVFHITRPREADTSVADAVTKRLIRKWGLKIDPGESRQRLEASLKAAGQAAVRSGQWEIIFIDAADQVTREQRELPFFLPGVLPDELPQGVLCVITSRRDESWRNKHVTRLEWNDNADREAARLFLVDVNQRLSRKIPAAIIDAIGQPGGDPPVFFTLAAMARLLTRAEEGEELSANERATIERLYDSPAPWRHPAEDTIRESISAAVELLRVRVDEATVWQAFAKIALAQEYLSIEQFTELGLWGKEENAVLACPPVRHFFRNLPQHRDVSAPIEFEHPGYYREIIEGGHLTHEEIVEIEATYARNCVRPWDSPLEKMPKQNSFDYARRHVVHHGVKAALWEEVVEPVLTDLLFIACRAQREGVSPLLGDFTLARKTWPRTKGIGATSDPTLRAFDRVDCFGTFVATHRQELRSNEPVALLAYNSGTDSPVRKAAKPLMSALDLEQMCPLMLCLDPPRFARNPACRMVLEGYDSFVAISGNGDVAISANHGGAMREWDLSTGEARPLETSNSRIRSIALSADGRTALCASFDPSIRVWDLPNGKIHHLNGLTNGADHVAISANRHTVVAVGEDGEVVVWGVGSPEPVGYFEPPFVSDVTSIAVSPDGCTVYLVAEELYALDLRTGELIQCFKRPYDIWSIALSADGRTLFGAGDETECWVWDVRKGGIARDCVGHDAEVTSVAISSDGRTAVSADSLGTICVWDTWKRKRGPSRVLNGHIGEVTSIAISSDGHTALSASEDGTLRVWNVETRDTGDPQEQGDRRIKFVSLSCNGCTVVAADQAGTLRVLDVNGGTTRVLRKKISDLECIALSPDGRSVVTNENGRVQVRDLRNGEITTIIDSRAYLSGVAISADGRVVASAGVDGMIRAWDIERRETLDELIGHNGDDIFVAMSADGRWLLSASPTGSPRIWELGHGRSPRILRGRSGFRARSIAISEDGTTAALADSRGTTQIWDLNTYKLKKDLKWSDHAISDVALTATGSAVISISEDRMLRVWDVDTGRCDVAMCRQETPTAIATSRAPARFAAADALILVGYANGHLERWLLSTSAASTRELLKLLPD